MENITLRRATIQDLPVLLDFEQALIRAERPFDVTIRPDPVSYYDIEEYILSKEVEVVVAQCNGQIVSSGYALAKMARSYLDHEAYGYLGFMYTLPEFRGRGINQKIVAKLIAWCTKRGLHEVRLTVYQQNNPAIIAYEKAGFKSHITEMRLRTSG
ncbi:GNAT family N-acetyltransferase [Muriicola sp. Z0-33]|uniref:GNAT family N-acetyltransferase n=1 Tax=Muriicola sp. Z0-33 TaxID=2816957 RepID=UPI00223722FF|nr:GNAT family N-acetyltransferase [Muriicola sp. Z0-33]MCW5517693.1 GNAT family N-acetyltransferase [Muriicola sp. Z0-33]